MANGGLITVESPRGYKWLERKPGHFIDWNISAHQTYFVRGTHTGIYKWMMKHADYSVSANKGDLYMQVRQLAEPLGDQLRKAYGGAALGGTPISAITAPANVAVASANAFGASASAGGALAANATVLASEVAQLAFDQVLDSAKGPGAFAQAMDKIGVRDKYHLYFTAVGPKNPAVNLPGSTLRFSGGQSYRFDVLARFFMTLKC